VTTDRPTPDPDIRLVTVLRANDPGSVAVARSILDGADIDYFVRGETIRNLTGWGLGGFSSALGETEFQVREADAPAASRLLARLDQPLIPNDGD
jgi:hypothetical protein